MPPAIVSQFRPCGIGGERSLVEHRSHGEGA